MDGPFPHQLLSGLVSPLTHDVAVKLCTEAWVRLGNAATATLITPLSPEALQVVVCRFVSGQRPEFDRFVVQEPCGTLLDEVGLKQIATKFGGTGTLRTFRWPDLLACLLVEWKSEPQGEDGFSDFHRTLILICRQLLARSSDHPVLFPNPNHLAAMAEFAAGAGHEINNPLGSILGQTQLLLKSETRIDRRQSLETIGSQAWRIRDMIGDAMLFARPPAAEFVAGNLVHIVRSASETTATNLADSESGEDIQVDFQCAETVIWLECDSVQISCLVSHLVRNAIEAIRSTILTGRVVVLLRTGNRGETAELLVRDTAPGIHDETVRRHLFDPFYSGRSAGRGLGFGLSLAWQIVGMHGGILLQYNVPQGGGCEFHVALPLRISAEESPAKDT